ncbi:MAG: hypothetical protein Q8P95_02265 [bacterium]|nr:hypothetical protein [bacterium]
MNRVLHIAILFAAVTAALFAMDLSGEGSTPLASILHSKSSLSTATLRAAGLENTPLPTPKMRQTLFASYLQVPDQTEVKTYHLKDLDITIAEVFSSKPLEIVQDVTSQTSPEYQLNVVSPELFYLNQLPLAEKTHNFLGLVIGRHLYGFQYPFLQHHIVLKMIDELRKNV